MENRRNSALKYFDRHRDFADDYVKTGIEKNRKGFARIAIRDKDGKPVKGATVKITQKSHDFKFGCNIFMLDEFETEEKSAIYRDTFKKYFNYATVPFYWSDLEPEYGKPRYAKDSFKVYRRPAPDLCVEYCKENGLRMKGHCLAYDTSCFAPAYLPRDPKEAKKMYEKHFAEVGARYADDIIDWDITNELLCPSSLDWSRNHPTLLREYDYLEWVYDLAYKYFPNNGRLINEACHLGDREFFENRSAYYMLVERLLKNGGKCTGVTMQAHSFVRPENEAEFAGFRYNPVYMAAQANLYADFRLPMQISEVTLPAYGLEKENEEIQAELLTEMYKMWFASPLMEGIVYWNLVDGYAAFAPQGTLSGENFYCGGMLRYDMSEKPVLKAYKALLDSWHTEESKASDDEGECVFKGFYGEYEVEITTENGVVKNTFHLDRYYERPYYMYI